MFPRITRAPSKNITSRASLGKSAVAVRNIRLPRLTWLIPTQETQSMLLQKR
jgi:hypothetical protein